MSSSYQRTASAQPWFDPLARAGALVAWGEDSVVMVMDREAGRGAFRRPCIGWTVCLVVMGMASIVVGAAVGEIPWPSVAGSLGLAGGMAAVAVFVVLMLRWTSAHGLVIFERGRIVVAWLSSVREIATAPDAPISLTVSTNGRYWLLGKPSAGRFTTRLKLPSAGFPGLDHLVETYNTTGLDGLFRLLDRPTV